MLDASEEDIATFWELYVREDRARSVRNEGARSIIDLVFIQWTRLNPLAATAAAEGTKFEEFAWWAWGVSRPQGLVGRGRRKQAQSSPQCGLGNRGVSSRMVSGAFRGDAGEGEGQWPVGIRQVERRG